jgi:transposase-like protein
MAARDRNSLEPTPCSGSQMTYTRFMELFPTHDACLDYLKDRFHPDGSECPGCGKTTKFHRIASRQAYSCQWCGHQVYPTAGTIFHKSTTNLQMWFWAIFLMSSTRCGISAKQLEREIGVSYPTAHRMFKQIRTLLSDEQDTPLSGDVEVDETFSGGKPRAYDTRQRRGHIRQTQMPTVIGMVERGGRVRARVVENRGKPALWGAMKEHILPESMIFTDEWRLYRGVGDHYRGHKRIKHKAKVYVDGDSHTQTIEGFFGLFKNGVRSVYHAISRDYLQDYLNEYAFRYNARRAPTPIFWLILDRVRKATLASA